MKDQRVTEAQLADFEQRHSGRDVPMLCAEIRRLQRQLAERKVIERAKGIVMQFRHMTEEDAHRYLQRVAQSSNRRLIEIAQNIVDHAGMLGTLTS